MKDSERQNFGLDSFLQHIKEFTLLFLRKNILSSADKTMTLLRWLIFLPLLILLIPSFLVILTLFVVIAIKELTELSLIVSSAIGVGFFVLSFLLLFFFRNFLLRPIDNKIVSLFMGLDDKVKNLDNSINEKMSSPPPVPEVEPNKINQI